MKTELPAVGEHVCVLKADANGDATSEIYAQGRISTVQANGPIIEIGDDRFLQAPWRRVRRLPR